jgi:hypothetical protein
VRRGYAEGRAVHLKLALSDRLDAFAVHVRKVAMHAVEPA